MPGKLRAGLFRGQALNQAPPNNPSICVGRIDLP